MKTDSIFYRLFQAFPETFFELINHQELARMFGLNELRKTRYYQEVREEVREELQQEVRQAVRQELQQEVRQEEALELIRRLLQRRLGAVNPELQEQVNLLSVAQLENLAEALLDFSNEADLVTWLSNNSNQLD